MVTFMIQLVSISQIKMFVNLACMQDFDIRIVSGHQSINAKSIMAVFCLDLSKPLRVEAYCHNCADFQRAAADYVITETCA